MAATLAPLPNKLSHEADASALARKRRREIMLSQRANNQTTPALPIPVATASVVVLPDLTTSAPPSNPEPVTKKPRKESTGATTKKKKPQMKYDPDVPMTKEEAAVWRREQRRKRNRESAAASRQRQRDRIAELEVEVDEWKVKYEEIMIKLTAMEEHTKMKVTDDLIDSLPTVSPLSPITNRSYSSTTSLPTTGKDLDDTEATIVSDSESEKEHDQDKMISRPAVKITGADASPPIDSMMLPVSMCPDPCLSSTTNKKTKSNEITRDSDDKRGKVQDKEQAIPSLLKDEETEFDAFLLDAVQWL